MNPLTAKFLAYNKKPKAPVACDHPKNKQRYEHSGFLSNEETGAERMARLQEAMANGLIISPLDFAWQYNRRNKSFVMNRKWREKEIRKNEKRTAFYCLSPKIVGGM